MSCPSNRRGFLNLRLLLPISLVTGIWVAGWYHYERTPRVNSASESRRSADHAVRSFAYSVHIEPLLKARCFECHGPKVQQAGLRFDRLEWLEHKHADKRIVVPGKPEQSELINIVSGRNANVSMPPEGVKLTDEQVATLAHWIADGAKVDRPTEYDGGPHWSFRPIQRPAIPQVSNGSWQVNPIDRFVLGRLEENDIRPAREADRATLFRRVHFDLIGLPPTPEELQEFLQDNAPDATERLVERLSVSPHYGEKWARHWLDQVRYADSDGYEIDHERANAWRYRNWVIDKLNANLPFDQFTTSQLAGDLIPDATINQLIATGMHRCAPLNREAGTNIEQNRFEQVANRVSTVSTVWLGLSVRCAQCHDHKFDPISQRDYYALFAFLDTTEDVEIEAALPGEVERHAARFAAYDQELAELLAKHDYTAKQAEFEDVLRQVAVDPDKFYPSRANKLWILISAYVSNSRRLLFTPPAERTRLEHDALLDFFLDKQIEIPELEAAIPELRSRYPSHSAASVVRERAEPAATHLRIRGDFFQPSEVVEPATLSALVSAGNQNHRPDRIALARWIMDDANPLTARVVVNRMWQQFFGTGLVSTTDDFGIQGERPSHPELLDWLAAEFRDSGRDVKHMHRLIVNSATYRQSSVHRTDLEAIDPGNRLLARQSRQRLSAELIRDAALKTSGMLHDSIGGRSIKPAQPKGVAELSEGGPDRWRETKSAERNKRGLYIHFQRTTPYPFLTNFDAPEMTVAACSRETSTTPLQALNLLNDPIFFEAAARFGVGLASFDAPEKARIEAAYWKCFSRAPSEREVGRIQQYRTVMFNLFATTPGAADEVCPKFVPTDARVETASWIMTARLLFNTDEFMNRE